MTYKNFSKAVAISAVASALLVGCGSDSDNSNTNQEDTTISGKAIDGYLKEAKVCLDLNGDGLCSNDGSEPYGETEENGDFTLTVTSAHLASSNFNNASLVVYDGIDIDTNKPFTGKLQAPNDDEEINVTPLTTLVAKAVQKATQEGETLTKEKLKEKVAAAESKVKKVLKIDESVDIKADPVVEGKELQKASLALQKSIQTMAKAKKTTNTEADAEQKAVDDIFEAFAIGMESIEDNATDESLGLENLITAVVENNASKEKLGTEAIKVAQTAKQIAKKVELAVENINGEDALKQVSSMIEQDLKEIETDLASFDFEDDNATLKFDSVDLNVTAESFAGNRMEELRTDAIKDELTFLGITDTNNTILTALGDDFYVWDLYEKYEEFENNTTLKPIFDAIKSQNDTWEEEKEKLEELAENSAIENSNQSLAIDLPFDIYDIESWTEYDDGENYIAYLAMKSSFQEDGSFSWTAQELENDTWVDKDYDDKILINGKWVSENSQNFTQNDDNSINIKNSKISLVNQTALATNYKVKALDDLNVTMPNGAIEYSLKAEKVNDTYSLWAGDSVRNYNSQTEEYFTSFSSFIDAQCGNRYFMSNKQKEHTGLAFEGVDNGDGTYSCESNATSGTLSEYSYDMSTHKQTITADMGTWEIKDVDGESIMIIKPKNNLDYRDEEDNFRTFALYDHDDDNTTDKVLTYGSLEPEGQVSAWKGYNDIAINAIKNALVAPESSDDNITTSITKFTSEYLDGKTLYYLVYDDFGHESQMGYNLAAHVFDASSGKVTHEEFDTIDVKNGVFEDSTFVVNSDGTLSIDMGRGAMKFTIVDSTDDYIQFTSTDHEKKGYYYFDKSKAEAKKAELNGDNNTFKFTTEYLNGKTLYNVARDCQEYDENGCTEENPAWELVEFSFTDTTFSASENGEVVKEDIPYSITSDGYITMTVQWEESGSPKTYWIKALLKTDDYIVLQWEDKESELSKTEVESNEYFYFDKTKAEARLAEETE